MSVPDDVTRLARLTSKTNWNDEGADPIPQVIWSRCFKLHEDVRLAIPSLPDPFFSPCADGTVFVSWTIQPTREVLIEVGKQDLKWSMRDAKGTFESGLPLASFEQVIEVLESLR